MPVTFTQEPASRPVPGIEIKDLSLTVTVGGAYDAEYIETFCRAVYRPRYTNVRRRCRNYTKAQAFIDPEDTKDGKVRVGLCSVHMNVKNLVIVR